jgi:hypothetical protein
VRERRDLARLNIVGRALPDLQRTVLFPDASGLFGHLAVRIELGAGNRHDETIHIVSHCNALHSV